MKRNSRKNLGKLLTKLGETPKLTKLTKLGETPFDETPEDNPKEEYEENPVKDKNLEDAE